MAAAALAVAATQPGGWAIVPLPQESANVVALTAPAANDVWAAGFSSSQETVGGHPVITLTPQVRHWDGHAWSIVPTAPLGDDRSARLNALDAVAGQLWAVGDVAQKGKDASLIEHYDGATWSLVPADDVPDADEALYGVAAISPTDVWAVGDASLPDHIEGVAQHWDGVRWTRVPLPAGLENSGLYAVAATGPDDVWAAGYASADPETGQQIGPLVVHWNGTTWARIALPSTADRGLASLSAVTVSNGQVWAAGNTTVGGALNRKPLVFRIDRWTAVIECTPDERGQINGMTMLGQDVWAAGYASDEEAVPHAYMLRRAADGTWRRAPAPDTPSATLSSIVKAGGTLWTSGATIDADGLSAPLIARLEGVFQRPDQR